MPNPSLSIFRTAARGLEAQRIAVGAATENIANATVTRPDGEAVPLRRAIFEADDVRAGRFNRFLGEASSRLRRTDPRHLPGGPMPRRLRPDEAGPITEVQDLEAERLEYDPSHPHADELGYVHYADVNVVEEMAHLISANRVYEANLSTVQAAKEMIKRTLEI